MKREPKLGETFVHCGHLEDSMHIWDGAVCLEGNGVQVPNWLLACNKCYLEANGRVRNVKIRGFDRFQFSPSKIMELH